MRLALILITLTLTFSMPLAAQQSAVSAAATSQAPSARFLSKAEARKALTEGEERAYFQGLQIPEMRAKTGLALDTVTLEEARAKTRQHYAQEVLDFNADERATLLGALSRLQPALMAKAPMYARMQWTFLKVSEKVEGGLPHTRGDAIVLSQPVLQVLVRQHLQRNFRNLDSFAANLLVHEQTHVIERRQPALFYRLFTEVFGFRRLTPAPATSWLREHGIVNPDAPECGWAFPVESAGQTRWIMPYLVLQNTQAPRMPGDFSMIGVTVEKRGELWTVVETNGQPEQETLSGIQAYAAAFPNQDEFYHPHEIAADLIAHWIVGYGGGDMTHPLRAKIATWGQANLR